MAEDARKPNRIETTAHEPEGTNARHEETHSGRLSRVVFLGLLCAAVLLAGHYALPKLRRLFEERRSTASAQGADAPIVPLPEGATLITDMPAGENRVVTSFRRYRSSLGEAEIEDFYERVMPSHGWKRLAEDARLASDENVLLYSNETGNCCIIAIAQERTDAALNIMILRGMSESPDAHTSD